MIWKIDALKLAYNIYLFICFLLSIVEGTRNTTAKQGFNLSFQPKYRKGYKYKEHAINKL